MGFIGRLKNAWNIFKLSLGLIKKDKSLVAIPIILILSSIFFFVSFLLIFFISKGIVLFYWIVFLFFMYFWSTFLSSAQSWMIYEVVHGKDTTVLSGIKRALKNLKDILIFAVVMLLIKILISSIRSKGRLGEILGSVLDRFTGIAGRLVLPAMIVTERNFTDAVKQLKDSLHAIPEIATYELGIGPLTSLVFFLGILIFIPLVILNVFIGILFIIILILLISLFSTYINNSYYTLLYLSLIEKKKIPELNILK